MRIVTCMKRLFLLLLLFTLLSFTLNDFLGKTTLVYREKSPSSLITLTCTVKMKENGITIEKFGDDAMTSLEYDNNFNLQKIHYNSAKLGSDYQFFKENGRLFAEGISKNKKYRTNFKARLPWVQDFHFGLKKFLKSNRQEIKFCILNPSDFTLVDMIAAKQNIEKISVNENAVIAQKIKITLTGFKKHFWKAEVWFNLEDDNLIKYVSNEGPGTPNSVTTLNKIF